MQASENVISLGRRHEPAPRRRRVSGIAILFGAVGLLLASNVVTALGLYFSPDINALFREDNSSIVTAYEQRITQLRLEVDRLHSRQYAQMGDMNLQMHDLVSQQEVLFEQHEYVRALTEMARDLGIVQQGEDADPLLTGSIDYPASPTDTADLAASLFSMQEETRLALVSLSDAATLSANEIADQLGGIGINASLDASDVGGPFLPARDTSSSIIDEANAVADALARYQAARELLLSAPIRAPIAGSSNVSSNFGNRTDPFLKRAAFHSGMDFRATSGTPVLSAAAGTVSFAGSNGGYGNMVEIDHGNGLVTRYAHLNRVLVNKGATIASGERVGLSGSTGRSTGPHLHFEVRRNGSAINPASFISAGRALSRFL